MPAKPAQTIEELRIRGKLPAGLGVGIIGARGATRKALAFAAELAAAAVAAGRSVISGGARGIDAAAHVGALEAGGRTVAVLGTGLLHPYPLEHTPLFDRIEAAGGAVVSPFPDDTPVARWRFPIRNHWIAELSSLLIVVEAGAQSGTATTIASATRLGRPVLARAGSVGCDGLLTKGIASVCEGPADLLEALAGRRRAQTQALPDDSLLRRVLAAVPREGSVDLLDVSRIVGASLDETIGPFLELEIDGLIIRDASGRYRRSAVEVC